jgi:Na+-driven multidrug efflux pump
MTFAAAKFRKFLPVAAFAMLAEFLMGVADVVITGHVIGDAGLSAVSLMQPVFASVSFVAMLVGTGTSLLYSTEMGRFDKRRASEFLTQGLWCAIGLGAIFAFVLVVFRNPALDLLGASEKVRVLAEDFWRWFIPCAILEPVAFFLFSMCSADGDCPLCTTAYGVQIVGNCALSVPLTMRYGVAGCAAGTAVGHVLAICVLLMHLKRNGNSLSFVRHFSFFDAGRIVSCAAGDASVRIFQAVLFFVLNMYVIARFGTERLPVLAAVIVVLGLSEAFDCVPAAAQPLVSVYFGERSDRLVHRIMRYAFFTSLSLGLVATAILALFPILVVKMVGISDPTLVADTEFAVRVVSIGLVGTALLVLYNSYCMVVGWIPLAAIVSFLAALAAPVALVLPFGLCLGERGVWLALGLAPFLAVLATAAIASYKRGWRGFPLFLDIIRRRCSRVYDLFLEPKAICEVSAKIGKYLAARIDKRRADLSSLLVEDSLMTVFDRNAGKKILAEVTLDLSDAPRIILRDDGEIFDLTDADAMATSFRIYFVSCLMAAIPARRNMTTTSFNRNMFQIDLEEKNKE